jgi:hypothetical protein
MARSSLITLVALAGTLFAAGTVSDGSLVGWVQKKVDKLQPTSAERTFDRIGWAPSLSAAMAASKAQNRPVFFFIYDGDIATGRC